MMHPSPMTAAPTKATTMELTTTPATATATAIATAAALSYNPNTDELFADGKLVGGASDLTRELMLDRLASPEDHAAESDETLFDLVVEAAE